MLRLALAHLMLQWAAAIKSTSHQKQALVDIGEMELGSDGMASAVSNASESQMANDSGDTRKPPSSSGLDGAQRQVSGMSFTSQDSDLSDGLSSHDSLEFQRLMSNASLISERPDGSYALDSRLDPVASDQFADLIERIQAELDRSEAPDEAPSGKAKQSKDYYVDNQAVEAWDWKTMKWGLGTVEEIKSDGKIAVKWYDDSMDGYFGLTKYVRHKVVNLSPNCVRPCPRYVEKTLVDAYDLKTLKWYPAIFLGRSGGCYKVAWKDPVKTRFRWEEKRLYPNYVAPHQDRG